MHELNEEIRDREIRLIGSEGEQLGIMSPAEAQRIADEQGLDLVKISPQATPPVCKLMNYGKFRFEQSKREKEARKNQHVVEIKEIRMSPGIDIGDFNTKLKNAQKFIADGNRVKVSVRFRGREMAHTDIGKDLLGIFGTIHPDMAKAYGVKQAVMGEFSMEVLLDNKPAKVKFEPISRYPSVSRDLAFVVDAGTAVADIIRSIKKCGKLDKENIIQDVEVFDVYAGEHVEEGKKSIALSITFQSAQRTLKDEDINQIHDKVLEALQKEVGAQLRA